MAYKKLQESSPLTADQRRNKFPVASEGWPFIVPLLGGAFLFWITGVTLGSLFLVLLAAAVGFFFRDPVRFPPAEVGAILAPADGRVVRIGPSMDGRRGTEVSIFLSLFDVHINRAPCAGRIEEVLPSAGPFGSHGRKKPPGETPRP